MKKRVLIISIMLCVSVLIAAESDKNDSFITQKKTIEQEILKVHAEMKQAAEYFDTDKLFTHVLDVNDVIIEDGQLRQTRKDALDITRQNLQGIKELTYSYSHKNINVISPTTAIWTSQGTTTIILEDGSEITGDFAETIVFVLQDEQWKVLHAHRSSPN